MKDYIFQLRRKIWRHDWSSQLTHNLNSCEIRALKAWTGFEPMTSAIAMFTAAFKVVCITAMINHVFISLSVFCLKSRFLRTLITWKFSGLIRQTWCKFWLRCVPLGWSGWGSVIQEREPVNPRPIVYAKGPFRNSARLSTSCVYSVVDYKIQKDIASSAVRSLTKGNRLFVGRTYRWLFV